MWKVLSKPCGNSCTIHVETPAQYMWKLLPNTYGNSCPIHVETPAQLIHVETPAQYTQHKPTQHSTSPLSAQTKNMHFFIIMYRHTVRMHILYNVMKVKRILICYTYHIIGAHPQSDGQLQYLYTHSSLTAMQTVPPLITITSGENNGRPLTLKGSFTSRQLHNTLCSSPIKMLFVYIF